MQLTKSHPDHREHITTRDWQARLSALACEAGENGDDNLEVGFLLLLRASRLSDTLRRGLGNVALMHMSLFETHCKTRRRLTKR